MKDWYAIRPFFLSLAVLAAALLIILSLVQADRASLLIPSPEDTAAGFLEALSAHRFTGAISTLSKDLQQQVKPEDLQKLYTDLENNSQGIVNANGQSAEEQANTAAASVQVSLGNQQETKLDFSLIKENGLWKLESLDPVYQLASGGANSNLPVPTPALQP